jgi:hypothetical protein
MATKGGDSARNILEHIFKGGLDAARVFDRATGGCRLNDASEHFLTAGVFKELSKLKGATHLEVSVKDCCKEAGAIRKGRTSKRDRKNGRYDLVHYRVDQRPRVAIEVKNGIRHANRAVLTSDFDRLARSLAASKDSSFQFCAFVFFATADYTKKDGTHPARRKRSKGNLTRLLSRIDEVAKEFTDHPSRKLLRRTYSSPVNYSRHEDEGAWLIGMIVFADGRAASTFPRQLFD